MITAAPASEIILYFRNAISHWLSLLYVTWDKIHIGLIWHTMQHGPPIWQMILMNQQWKHERIQRSLKEQLNRRHCKITGDLAVTGGFTSQRTSNVESVSKPCCRHKRLWCSPYVFNSDVLQTAKSVHWNNSMGPSCINLVNATETILHCDILILAFASYAIDLKTNPSLAYAVFAKV